MKIFTPLAYLWNYDSHNLCSKKGSFFEQLYGPPCIMLALAKFQKFSVLAWLPNRYQNPLKMQNWVFKLGFFASLRPRPRMSESQCTEPKQSKEMKAATYTMYTSTKLYKWPTVLCRMRVCNIFTVSNQNCLVKFGHWKGLKNLKPSSSWFDVY